jgi:formyltetrahydrofolate synthetase
MSQSLSNQPMPTQTMLPIQTIAEKLNLPEEYFEPIGRHGAKLKLSLMIRPFRAGASSFW